MLTDGTTNGIVVMESVNQDQAERATKAMADLAELIQQYFGIKPDKTAVLKATDK